MGLRHTTVYLMYLSHDCLSDVFAKIDTKKFMEIFIEWVKEVVEEKTGKCISIDGKAVRGATDKINGGNIQEEQQIK